MAFSKFVKSGTDIIAKAASAKSAILDSSLVNIDELKTKASDAVTGSAESFAKYFSESKLLEKLQNVAKVAGATVLYPVLILWKLFQTNKVPASEKILIAGTLGYFILPIDIIPDAIVGPGYADDAAALMTCLKAVLENVISTDIPVVAKKELHSLLGDFDENSLNSIDSILDISNNIVNK